MVLDDLGIYLQANGLGVLGQTIFLGTIPQDAPGSGAQDALLGLFEVPGLPPEHVHDIVGPAVEEAFVLLRFRGAPYGYAAARTKAQQAYILLDSVVNQTINGVWYQQIMARHGPHGMPADEWNRPFVHVEFRCCKQP